MRQSPAVSTPFPSKSIPEIPHGIDGGGGLGDIGGDIGGGGEGGGGDGRLSYADS